MKNVRTAIRCVLARENFSFLPLSHYNITFRLKQNKARKRSKEQSRSNRKPSSTMVQHQQYVNFVGFSIATVWICSVFEMKERGDDWHWNTLNRRKRHVYINRWTTMKNKTNSHTFGFTHKEWNKKRNKNILRKMTHEKEKACTWKHVTCI